MTDNPYSSYPRYLAAKRSLDDRCLNRHVWYALARHLPYTTPERPLRVLEVGAGIGTMFERAVEWNLLHHAHYHALDSSAENIATALERLPVWASKRAMEVKQPAPNQLEMIGPNREFQVNLETIDLFDFLDRQEKDESGTPAWDLIIAHAFLDIVDLSETLPRLLALIQPGGFFLFTLNFDGMTLFEPPLDPNLDAAIEALYHKTMDNRWVNNRPSGESRSGRRLFSLVKDFGGEILAAGASDWVVTPIAGAYEQDEAYFLHFIIATVQQALQGDPELDPAAFEQWIAARHAQIERGELTFIAHQLDFAGRNPAR
ncbi:MAG TPA: class I SAM-dependent methyltransferase [Anaerolineales bacterium]|nr:class I SAM-dependent methyltransferase [Anaerolineales bacterium]